MTDKNVENSQSYKDKKNGKINEKKEQHRRKRTIFFRPI